MSKYQPEKDREAYLRYKSYLMEEDIQSCISDMKSKNLIPIDANIPTPEEAVIAISKSSPFFDAYWAVLEGLVRDVNQDDLKVARTLANYMLETAEENWVGREYCFDQYELEDALSGHDLVEDPKRWLENNIHVLESELNTEHAETSLEQIDDVWVFGITFK